jgi:predicted metalloprotease
MRWEGRERSENVEDRRGRRPSASALGGGGMIVLLFAAVAWFLGADPRAVIGIIGQQQALQQQGVQQAPAPDDKAREFIEVVLKDTENVWTKLFAEQVQGGAYTPPRLIIYAGTDRSACGVANAAMGPFYCPADQMIYIDPSFFDELKNRHGAPGDFAQAYVIAHEVAHHVQKLIGFSEIADRARASRDKTAANRASVRLELQADYLAGVWAHHAQREYNILEEGDIAEAMNAANQIGDDTLQKLSQGYVVPERFTHGSSAQRVRWFRSGLASGDLAACQEIFEIDYDQL